MVSVVHLSRHAPGDSAEHVDLGMEASLLDFLGIGLSPAGREKIGRALHLAAEWYGGGTLGSGELALDHAFGMAQAAAALNLDLDARLAALLFAAAHLGETRDWQETVIAEFGPAVLSLVDGLHRLGGLRLLTRSASGLGGTVEGKAQAETLRKMLLAMVEDIRVVLLRLASRTQTLRYLTGHPGTRRTEIAHESMEIYAPLANRLGVWQLKWELEDLSFRFIEPETYKRIAKMLDERRVEREHFIATTMARLKAEVAAAGIDAEVYGRPKHIYSIWNKMRGKRIEFDEVYDVRALRVLVNDVKDCYTVLGIVHHRWQPVPGEFDDYIAQPKGNDYRSLHTAVMAEDGRPFEVQIRTHEMHRHAELGVAAHWRYKEAPAQGAGRSDSEYDDKIAWLRQLLSWRDEIADSAEWVAQFKRAALDDTIYVLTPQGRVFDLARGATPVDFAYRLHTDIGHRCRGARVDGQLVPLNTPLANGQRVEIVTVKQGGPSRDWLNPAQGYLATSRARQKVKQWFSAQEEETLLAQGRAFVMRELQREGQTQANIEALAQKLGHENAETLYLAAGRGEVGTRSLQAALHGDAAADREKQSEVAEMQTRRSRMQAGSNGILIVGVDNLLTQLARCCKPVPPDPICGFVTRGKGVSIHRADCRMFKSIAGRDPERVIVAEWGGEAGTDARSAAGQRLYPVDIVVDAQDRQSLLRDISEVLSRERVNVTAAKTLSRSGMARMSFTIELHSAGQLQRVLKLVREVPSVTAAQRG